MRTSPRGGLLVSSPNRTITPGGARISAQLLVALSIAAAVGVFLDARLRLRRDAALAWAIATLLAVGLVLPAYMLVRPSRQPAWGLTEVVAFTLFFAVTIPLLASTVFHTGPGATPPLSTVIALALIQNAGFVAGVLYVVRVKYRLPAASVGLDSGVWPRRVWQGGAAAALAVVGNTAGQNATVYALALVMGHRAASALVSREQVRTPVYRILPQVHARGELTALALVLGIAVPIGEEMFFRGLTLGALRRRMNRHLAILISALFFAVAHLEPVELLPILILGLILAYTYEYTGSLVPGMIAHGINNVLALITFYQTPSP
jgi:membrane protease YdiL (CAAX protease family)